MGNDRQLIIIKAGEHLLISQLPQATIINSQQSLNPDPRLPDPQPFTILAHKLAHALDAAPFILPLGPEPGQLPVWDKIALNEGEQDLLV
jgi:hypothetical protein